MPVSDDEAERLISHIVETVRGVAGESSMRGITELIDQWKADVEAGRPIERKLRIQPSPSLVEFADTRRSRSATSGDFIGKEDYTILEQLDMLVVSLYLAFLVPSMMSERLLGTIEKYGRTKDQQEKSDPIIHLLGVATTDVSSTSPRISHETIAQSNESTEKLATLLNEIVQEAGLTPRIFIDGKGIS